MVKHHSPDRILLIIIPLLGDLTLRIEHNNKNSYHQRKKYNSVKLVVNSKQQ